MVWHVRDLMADFRAVYHLGWREALALPGPEFCALAYRADAFPGVMAARREMAHQKAHQEAHRNAPAGARMVGLDDPSVQSLIEFS